MEKIKMSGIWKSDVDENVYGSILLFHENIYGSLFHENINRKTVKISFDGPIWKNKIVYGYREIYPIEINKSKDMLLDGIASYIEYIIEKNENRIVEGSYHSSHPIDNGKFIINFSEEINSELL